MAAIYALSDIVDTIGEHRVGRLIWRYSEPWGALDPKHVVEVLEWRNVEPYRRYWIGRDDKPRLVRVYYEDGRFSLQVYSWRKSRVSWRDASPLTPVGTVLSDRILFYETEAA